MGWFNILKNIQISSQQGKQKDIILPPEEDDDEDCRLWWSLLEANIEAMIEVFVRSGGRWTLRKFSFELENYTNEELCKFKKDILAKTFTSRKEMQSGRFGETLLFEYNGTNYEPDTADIAFVLQADGQFKIMYKLGRYRTISALLGDVFLPEWKSYLERIDSQLGSNLLTMFEESTYFFATE